MASLFEKARIAALAAAHKLMDKVVDLNSVEAVKQYVRDVENALEDLEDASATAAGHVRSVQRDAEQIRSQAKELNQNIDFILSDKKPENDHLATPLEARLIGLEQRLTTKDEEIITGQKTAQALSEAVSTLRTRYQNMVQQIQRLEAMDRTTKAKESAVHAIKQAGQIASAGSDVSIDAVADRIQRRADVADARFERALGEMSGQVEKDVVIAQAQARLEARKARLALPSGEQTQ
jgi:phage shock protein A